MARAQQRAEARRDPDTAGADDFSVVFHLSGADPTKKYNWVDNATAASGPGLDYYENIEGWDIEIWRDGGPRPRGVKYKPEKNGQAIVVLDQTLMSIDKATWEARRVRGQKRADAVEKKMIRRRGQVDRMRGIGNLHGENFNNNRYTRYDGEIDPLVPEIGES